MSNSGRISRDPVALVVNTHSRRARKDPKLLDRLSHLFGDRGPLIASQRPSELPDAMSAVRRTQPDTLFICGGDGTLRQTLTHLRLAYGDDPLPKIAILRGGTMNTVATSLGIHRHPTDQLRLLLERYDQSLPFAVVERHLLRVNHHCGFIFAVGGFSRFIEYYAENPDPTPTYAFRRVAQTIISSVIGGALSQALFEPFTVSIQREGKVWFRESRVTNVAASAIQHIGFGFKPFYGAEGANGSFGLLVLAGPPRELVKHFVRLYQGRPVNDASIVQLPSYEVVLETEKPMSPMLDGDILQAEQRFELRSGPKVRWVVG